VGETAVDSLSVCVCVCGGLIASQSAYASSPCYLCAAAALSTSETSTSGRPHPTPVARAAGAGGRRQWACGPLPIRTLPASQRKVCDCARGFSALHRSSCVRHLQVASACARATLCCRQRKARHCQNSSRPPFKQPNPPCCVLGMGARANAT
jgi:hypothetical protein